MGHGTPPVDLSLSSSCPAARPGVRVRKGRTGIRQMTNSWSLPWGHSIEYVNSAFDPFCGPSCRVRFTCASRSSRLLPKTLQTAGILRAKPSSRWISPARSVISLFPAIFAGSMCRRITCSRISSDGFMGFLSPLQDSLFAGIHLARPKVKAKAQSAGGGWRLHRWRCLRPHNRVGSRPSRAPDIRQTVSTPAGPHIQTVITCPARERVRVYTLRPGGSMLVRKVLGKSPLLEGEGNGEGNGAVRGTVSGTVFFQEPFSSS